LTTHNELLLFMGEGRLSLHSLGFTLKETAELLIAAGAYTAINLDGGGSSGLFVDGRYYGFSPTGARKAVPDAIVFGDFPERGAIEYPF
jgi:exopolysaccharide biosynthesis protein